MLKDINVLKSLKDEDLKILEDSLKIQKVKKREIIFNEGDKSEWLYVLINGKVKISKIAKDGREIILEIIDEKDFFGALAVIKGIPYPANAVALEDCEVGKIPSRIFLSVVKKYPHIESEILYHVTTRLKSGIESLKNIAIEDVASRIVYQLINLANRYAKNTPEGILIDLRITKQQLAEMTGTTVETAIRVISKLKKLGYISELNHKFLIKDIKALKNFF